MTAAATVQRKAVRLTTTLVAVLTVALKVLLRLLALRLLAAGDEGRQPVDVAGALSLSAAALSAVLSALRVVALRVVALRVVAWGRLLLWRIRLRIARQERLRLARAER